MISNLLSVLSLIALGISMVMGIRTIWLLRKIRKIEQEQLDFLIKLDAIRGPALKRPNLSLVKTEPHKE